MSIRCRTLVSRVPASFLVLWICLCCFPGTIFAAVVSLDAIQIFRTHELILPPKIYFKCKHEFKTVIPDVNKQNVPYTFKGEESWQPLTDFGSKKCKRCGIYAVHNVKSDDELDEWEFCPSQFKAPEGKYIYGKKNEFNATFSCPQCISLIRDADDATQNAVDNKIHAAILVAVTFTSAVIGTLLIITMVKSLRNWQRKKRLEEQARFLKLFEDGDDIEDELGLGTIV